MNRTHLKLCKTYIMTSFLHVDLQIAAIGKRRTMIIFAKIYRFKYLMGQNGRTRFREWCYSMMTRFCSKKIYEQTGTKATEIHSYHCLYCDTIFPQFDDLIKHSRENHPHHCYYCKTTFVLFEEVIKHSTAPKNYEQTGTKAFIFSGITLKLWLL
jgi:hypothetical protein